MSGYRELIVESLYAKSVHVLPVGNPSFTQWKHAVSVGFRQIRIGLSGLLTDDIRPLVNPPEHSLTTDQLYPV